MDSVDRLESRYLYLLDAIIAEGIEPRRIIGNLAHAIGHTAKRSYLSPKKLRAFMSPLNDYLPDDRRLHFRKPSKAPRKIKAPKK